MLMEFGLSDCLSVCLYFCLSLRLPVFLYICQYLCLTHRLLFCILSARLSLSPSVCLYVPKVDIKLPLSSNSSKVVFKFGKPPKITNFPFFADVFWSLLSNWAYA